MADELVLIVDDNEKNLKLARDVLRHAGFRTIEAETGSDGVSLAVEHLPDLVLMDIGRSGRLDDIRADRQRRAEVDRHQAQRAASPDNVIFGPNGFPSGDFDIGEFREYTSGDPGDWYENYRCFGSANDTGYCSHAVDALLKAAGGELNSDRRARLFQRADAIMATQVPIIPMYQEPIALIHRSDLIGMRRARAPAGRSGTSSTGAGGASVALHGLALRNAASACPFTLVSR
jgi:ABC-type oligopeptide transport system substrate-binding subunit